MAQQPNLFPPNPPGEQQAASAPPSGTAPQARSASIPLMARIEAIIRIVVRLYLGLLVLVLPWLAFWTQNNLFTYDPVLLSLASSGFVRGVVSGLGLLNIGLAVLDAKTARELS